MVTAQDAFLVAIGVIACFMGYSLFRDMLPVWGFIIGGWITYTLLPAFFPFDVGSDLLYAIITFGIGGIIGAIIATPLYFVMIFLAGMALGMFMGIMLGALIDVGGISSARQLNQLTNMAFPPVPRTMMQYILMIVFGLVLGGVSVNFQKFMVSASSAFVGAAAIITGLGGSVTQIGIDMSKGAIMIVAWIILGLIGMVVQFRSTGEV